MSKKDGLADAIKAGRITSAAQLQKRGLSVNSTNKDGQTALHVAAFYGKLPLVRDLVAHGAYFDIQDAQGFTPLYLAAVAGRATVVNFLLYIGADPGRQDKSGWTPLHAAAFAGQKDSIRELLNSPLIVVNVEASPGLTAVWLAETEGHDEIVDMLQAQRPAVRGTQADEAREHFLRPAPPAAINNEVDPIFGHDEDFPDVVDEWTVFWSVAMVAICGVIRFVYTKWLALESETP
eukprot:comp23862_c0_seq1/m.41777 comp23862_c0_seq1/g.41777  ORF comp23862_c0_seq1/g.41777 comp23862_c0_seq1/m.41777 type:complete len:235 (-) comp23862_c0_seq1:649-1353(-)